MGFGRGALLWLLGVPLPITGLVGAGGLQESPANIETATALPSLKKESLVLVNPGPFA